MIILSTLVGAGAGALLLPTVSDLLALAGTAAGRRRPPHPQSAVIPHLLFLVPAHDEELLIASCVDSLRVLHYPPTHFDTVVIADNCGDRTAVLAREAGARCLERTDRTKPGKPHAIAWALEQLRWRQYDAVIIVDADSVVDPDFAAELACAAPLADKAVQGYHMVRNPSETSLTRLGALLGEANHRFAYPRKQRAGLNVPLLGNGMCIGTGVLARHGWHAFTICEDWEMYAALTTAGVRIDGCPTARVASQEARTLEQSGSQRRRWTAGKLTVLARYALPLARSRQIGWRQKLDALAELAAPGPAVHLGVVALLASALLLLRPPGAELLGLALILSLFRPALYVLAALRADPDPWGALRALAFLPAYTVWRLGIAAGSLTMLGDRPWIRTARHRTPDAPSA